MKEIMHYSQQQSSASAWFEDFTDIEEWIDDISKVDQDSDNKNYYHHVDHLQIVPGTNLAKAITKGKYVAGYHVFVVFHKVHLSEDK